MERISLGGRPAVGFGPRVGELTAGRTATGLAAPLGAGGETGASPIYAGLMTGAAVGLLVYVLKVPVWGAVVAGAGAALATKVGIDRIGGA